MNTRSFVSRANWGQNINGLQLRTAGTSFQQPYRVVQVPADDSRGDRAFVVDYGVVTRGAGQNTLIPPLVVIVTAYVGESYYTRMLPFRPTSRREVVMARAITVSIGYAFITGPVPDDLLVHVGVTDTGGSVDKFEKMNPLGQYWANQAVASSNPQTLASMNQRLTVAGIVGTAQVADNTSVARPSWIVLFDQLAAPTAGANPTYALNASGPNADCELDFWSGAWAGISTDPYVYTLPNTAGGWTYSVNLQFTGQKDFLAPGQT